MTAQSIQNVLSAAGDAIGSGEFDDECEEIFQEFDPPIVCGTYNEVRETTAGTNQQAEHLIANSGYQTNRSANTNMPGEGVGDYSQFTAFAYNVWDAQSHGTEHRCITDAAKEFENANPHATTRQRLDASKEWTKESLKSKHKPTKDSPEQHRMKNPDREDADELAEAAAKCLVEKAKAQFEKQGVDLDAPTRNGLTDRKLPTSPDPPADNMKIEL